MFKIIIKNLRLFGYHGLNEDEKKNGQEFLFNIIIFLNRDKVSQKDFLKNDDIRDTVNYSKIVALVKDLNKGSRFNLIETLSSAICEKIISFFPVIEKVWVSVAKTSPPITERIDSVGVEAEISRAKEIKVFLSLGSNIGNREANLRKAVSRISKNKSIDVIKVSSIYETEAMYVKDQDSFLNIILEASVREGLNPFELLGYLKSIEYDMGRKSSNIRYGPRIIDIDILFFGDVKINSDYLVLPHPRIMERKFVLIPLFEIAPGLLVKDMKLEELISNNKLSGKVEKIKNW